MPDGEAGCESVPFVYREPLWLFSYRGPGILNGTDSNDVRVIPCHLLPSDGWLDAITLNIFGDKRGWRRA